MSIRKKIWEFCLAEGMTEAGAAGLMGNIEAESAFLPDNVENRCSMSDGEYTAAVSRGDKPDFAYDGYGYGLCQWTYPARKAALLSYARECGADISDADMQLRFMLKELRESFPKVLRVLKTTDSVREASDAVMKSYENPADQSERALRYRAELGERIFREFKEQEKSPTPPKLFYGSSGEGVRAMQTLLKLRGESLACDGIFGSETDGALRNFQQKKGLASDGVCGILSWQALIGD